MKDRPQREEPTLSLLERLSNPETHKEKRIPLRERLSDKLKPLLSCLGWGRAPNRKLSSKSVRSLPQSKLEMSNRVFQRPPTRPSTQPQLEPQLNPNLTRVGVQVGVQCLNAIYFRAIWTSTHTSTSPLICHATTINNNTSTTRNINLNINRDILH